MIKIYVNCPVQLLVHVKYSVYISYKNKCPYYCSLVWETRFILRTSQIPIRDHNKLLALTVREEYYRK